MEDKMCPRPTPEELKRAKEQKKQKDQETERYQREERKQKIRFWIRWEQTSSELDGLYEELDKIYKKAPEEQISNLTLDNVNNLIKDTKQMIEEDPYIDRIKEFVPAGDNPEYRDVIMVLRQLRQGMDRFKRSYFREHESLSDLTEELQELETEEE
jgi:hypothetical protein